MSVTPMRAADFVATIGVNAHINDPNSSYATSNVLQQMEYLGITNMRVSDYSGTQLAEYKALGAAGIKFDAVTVIAPQNAINLGNEIADLDQIAPYLKSVEGPNEVNTDPVSYNGLTGAAAADAFQADLYHAVQADPALAGVQVLPFSLSVGGSLTGFGNVNAYATEANVHGYASGGVPPYYYLNYAVSSVATVTDKPVVMSETGYYTLADGNSGVSQYVQGVWELDVLLQNAADGIVNTDLYQLEDGYDDQPNNPEDHYGLFTTAGTPKQAAVDIHNLTTILADPGATAGGFTPGTLNDSVSGLNPDYGFQTVFAKSNGAFDVALWSEPQFYDAATETQSAVTPSAVTVSLGGSYNVAVFDPVTGTAAIQTASDVSSVTVALGTDPLIVELTPINAATVAAASTTSSTSAPSPVGASGGGGGAMAAPAAAVLTPAAATPTPAAATPTPATATPTPAAPVMPLPATTAPVTTLGSGPDTLALQISEDAYQGDASFTVAVNGQQIGGVLTSTALHGDGASQTFDVAGNFSGGPNIATVTFLNDDYGGSPSLDRNLYVDAATINGQTIGGAAQSITTNGPVHFQFSDPAAASTLGAGTASSAPAVASAPVNGGVVTAASAPVPTVVAGAPTVTVGTGAETLALSMSEDAYQGDAQFTVKVDGQQVGGVQTVTALHGTGASQTFNVLGNWAAGSHVATVAFLNDNYGGSPSLDRNLYVNGSTINGQAISGGAVSIPYNGPANFGFVAPGH